jgi:hypothetical protein
MFENTIEIEKKTEKNFMAYQQGDIDAIFERYHNDLNNIFVIPTTGENSDIL